MHNRLYVPISLGLRVAATTATSWEVLGDVAKWLRRRSAKLVFPGSNPGASLGGILSKRVQDTFFPAMQAYRQYINGEISIDQFRNVKNIRPVTTQLDSRAEIAKVKQSGNEQNLHMREYGIRVNLAYDNKWHVFILQFEQHLETVWMPFGPFDSEEQARKVETAIKELLKIVGEKAEATHDRAGIDSRDT